MTFTLLVIAAAIILTTVSVLWMRSLPSLSKASDTLLSESAGNCNACPNLCGREAQGIVNMSKWYEKAQWRTGCLKAMRAAHDEGRAFKNRATVVAEASRTMRNRYVRAHQKATSRKPKGGVRLSTLQRMKERFRAEMAMRRGKATMTAHGLKYAKHHRGWMKPMSPAQKRRAARLRRREQAMWSEFMRPYRERVNAKEQQRIALRRESRIARRQFAAATC